MFKATVLLAQDNNWVQLMDGLQVATFEFTGADHEKALEDIWWFGNCPDVTDNQCNTWPRVSRSLSVGDIVRLTFLDYSGQPTRDYQCTEHGWKRVFVQTAYMVEECIHPGLFNTPGVEHKLCHTCMEIVHYTQL